jgi:tetratricopeptide (TPR) repeat protein
MLGRVYMQTGAYDKAKAALLAIPTSGNDGYWLVDRYLDNFELETKFNPEAILEVTFYDKGDNNFNWGGGIKLVGDGPAADQTTVRNQEYCPVAWRNLIPSNKYLNEFENTATGAAKTDPRFSYSVYQTGDWFNNNTEQLTADEQNGNSSVVNGVTKKVSWRKYMLIYREHSSFHPGGNDQRVIRYAEVLLNLAECENELGNTAQAIAYLNRVRARPSVNMPPYPTTQYPCGNKDQVTKAIMHERMVELGDEEVRNIDIIRWRKKGYFTTDPLPYFRPNRDELLPIPQFEIDNNPKLGSGGIPAQNPGY